MTREEQFMPNGIPRKIRCYDNSGKSFDRYTVVYTGNYKERDGCDYVGMSENPSHPQGFGQHGWSQDIIDYPSYKHLGKKIKFTDLPPKCQDMVIDDYKAIWGINRVECSLCGMMCDGATAHQHNNKYIGDECCWDERLRTTE